MSAGRPVLEAAIYEKAEFRNPKNASFLKARLSTSERDQLVALMEQTVAAWDATVQGSTADAALKRLSLPAVFDVLMSALYAWLLHDAANHKMRRKAFLHRSGESATGIAFFPYVWMCPACLVEGAERTDAYLPNYRVQGARAYAKPAELSRPGGRLIGDLGALCVRAIVEALALKTHAAADVHFAAGGGHRGEFDLLISTADLLILGEIKASPLVAFPLVVDTTATGHHEWIEDVPGPAAWSFFVAAAPAATRRVALGAPSGNLWPMSDLVRIAADEAAVVSMLKAWARHLDGYRAWGAKQADKSTPGEPEDIKWHRFGCGNFRGTKDGRQLELRVDNTKTLPGLDRTDDVKKGTSQVLLFDRLKRDCRRGAVKTVLFGNLFAETHHAHYVQPVYNVQIKWPNSELTNLFDGIVGLSRNIFNDDATESLLGLASEPYAEPSADEVVDAIAAATDEDDEE